MEMETILTIISAVLGVVAIAAAAWWAKAKNKLNDVKVLAKEAVDLVQVAVGALDDDKITKDEVESIKKEAQDVKSAWRSLIGKS